MQEEIGRLKSCANYDYHSEDSKLDEEFEKLLIPLVGREVAAKNLILESPEDSENESCQSTTQ